MYQNSRAACANTVPTAVLCHVQIAKVGQRSWLILIMSVYLIKSELPNIRRPPNECHRFKLRGKLLCKIACQGKVAPLISKGGLKSDSYNLSVRLESGPVGSAVQISK